MAQGTDRIPGTTNVQFGEQPRTDDEVCAVGRRRFQEAEEFEAEYRKHAVEDLEFEVGKQWPVDISNARHLDRRPTLTINRIPATIQGITNDYKQNPGSIRVSPVGDGADRETADTYQGIIRHIEYDSNATAAYDKALDSAAGPGRGYYRINTAYVDEMSFDQKIIFQRIVNPLQVYVDPHAQEIDYSDMEWCFIVSQMSKDEFYARWPNADQADNGDIWVTTGDGWIMKDACRIAEYYYKERTAFTLVEVWQGANAPPITMDQADLTEEQKPFVTARRQSFRDTVRWVTFNGYQVLERTEWPGRWIPILPVIGRETYYENKPQLSGVTRHAKDPQRMINYWASSEAETIALAPRSPWVGARGQFESSKAKWDTANNRNWSYLEYDVVMTQGQAAPPPKRNVMEPPVMAITNARMMANEDLKAVTGRFDASLGARSNEQSGIAIRQRQAEGDTTTAHFGYNLNMSRRHAGRLLIDLIPKVYREGQVVQILREDMTDEMVTLWRDPHTQLDKGRYGVVVDTGPSYLTKRQEAADSMVGMTSAYPQIMAIGGDLLVKNLDWPGAAELADRLRRTIDPSLLEGSEDAETQLAQAQGMVQQLQKELEALNAYAQQQEQDKDELEQKNAELQVSAKGKDDENTIKRQELALEAEIERAKLVIEEQKLIIEAQKAGMDVGELDSQASPVRLWLQELEERVQSLMRVEVQEHTLKAQPKLVQVIRQNGTLLGRVQEADGSLRDFVIEQTPNGYVGRIEGESQA